MSSGVMLFRSGCFHVTELKHDLRFLQMATCEAREVRVETEDFKRKEN